MGAQRKLNSPEGFVAKRQKPIPRQQGDVGGTGLSSASSRDGLIEVPCGASEGRVGHELQARSSSIRPQQAFDDLREFGWLPDAGLPAAPDLAEPTDRPLTFDRVVDCIDVPFDLKSLESVRFEQIEGNVDGDGCLEREAANSCDSAHKS